MRVRPLVRPHLAHQATARLRHVAAVVAAADRRVALAKLREAVGDVEIALLDVARLVAFAVSQPVVVAARHAAVEREGAERVVRVIVVVKGARRVRWRHRHERKGRRRSGFATLQRPKFAP